MANIGSCLSLVLCLLMGVGMGGKSALASSRKPAQQLQFVKAVSGPALYDGKGRIDVAKTIKALRRVGANAFVLSPAYQKQWDDILAFLPQANKAGIKVYLILPDAREGAGRVCPFCKGKGRCKHWRWHLPKPYCKDYIKWMETLAKLSLKYPVLEGVFIDDFEAGAFSRKAGFTVDYIRQVMEAKNRINPKFKFLPGIYIPRGLCDFEFTQRGGSVRHNRKIAITATYTCKTPPKQAVFQLITHEHRSQYFVQRLYINGEVVFADTLKGGPRMVRFDLRVHHPKRWEFKYEILHTGFVNYLSCFVAPWLFVDGKRVALEWKVIKDDERFVCNEYARGKLKPYYELTDGVIFWANAFDLLKPESEIFQVLMDEAKGIVGTDKFIFGHFYGAEPWREPVFPSQYYFDTFVKLTMQCTDGVAPWYACLLPHYVGYSSGIYAEPKKDKSDYDFHFRYPSYTSYELGFYQGISATFKVPERLNDAQVTFRIQDDKPGSYAGRWVKEFVVRTGRFVHQQIPRKEFIKSDKLWFREVGTVWHDFLRGDEGEQTVTILYEALKPFLAPGQVVTLVLRMRADMFRGAGSAPPEVNVYVTKPKVTINGQRLNLTWKFESGNALEALWLRSSEALKNLFTKPEANDRRCGHSP